MEKPESAISTSEKDAGFMVEVGKVDGCDGELRTSVDVPFHLRYPDPRSSVRGGVGSVVVDPPKAFWMCKGVGACQILFLSGILLVFIPSCFSFGQCRLFACITQCDHNTRSCCRYATAVDYRSCDRNVDNTGLHLRLAHRLQGCRTVEQGRRRV